LYGEVAHDLLQNAIEVNIATYGGNYLSELEVHTEEEVHDRLMEGMKLRTTAETKMNEKSSRSHLLVTFHLYNDMKKMAKLTLVDLAGSENLKRSEVQNERKKEAQNINLSLFELTNVLRDLTIPNKVVSYRNSKLTMMLKVRLE
jgi:plus-end-directed kinesin ATPase